MTLLPAALLLLLAVLPPAARGTTDGEPLLAAAAGELHSRTDLPGAETGRGESGLQLIRLREGRARDVWSGAVAGKRLSGHGGRLALAVGHPCAAPAVEPPVPASLEWLPYHAAAPPTTPVLSSRTRS